MSVVALADAKAFLNIKHDDSDFELSWQLQAAEQIVESRCGALSPRSVTEVVYEHGSVLVLRELPVLSIESVMVAPYLGAAGVDDSAGWVLDPVTGVARRALVGGVGFYGRSSVLTVTYTTGRQSAPFALQFAVLVVLEQMWQSQRGPVPSTGPMAAASDAPSYMGGAGFLVPPRALEAMLPYLLPPGAA